MRFLHRALVVAFASCLLAAPASAQLVSFTFSGGLSASWTLSENTAPDLVTEGSFGFDFLDIVYEGVPQTVAVDFYAESELGGVCIDAFNDCMLGDLLGEQLYTGPTSSPQFVFGSFALVNGNDGSNVDLVIERVASVPEPSALVLLAVGAAGLLSVRRRRYSARA